MSIEYIHTDDLHTLKGSKAALPIIFSKSKPSSILDVGCGTGTWLKAAVDFGISDICGVDGVRISSEKLHVASEKILHQDLTKSWSLSRRFDAVICLEVAEHLEMVFAVNLIDTLVKHGDQIYFSAACPDQPGQHHVNCQWPDYWQQLFNDRGYVCEDTLRWQIWDDSRIEPWYRQNLFLARKDFQSAGKEPRIMAVIHPAMRKLEREIYKGINFRDHIHQIEQGRMSILWNLTIPIKALKAKIKRKSS